MSLLEVLGVSAAGSFLGVSVPAIIGQKVFAHRMRRKMVKRAEAAATRKKPGEGVLARSLKAKP